MDETRVLWRQEGDVRVRCYVCDIPQAHVIYAIQTASGRQFSCEQCLDRGLFRYVSMYAEYTLNRNHYEDYDKYDHISYTDRNRIPDLSGQFALTKL